jgi:hypothetical protein
VVGLIDALDQDDLADNLVRHRMQQLEDVADGVGDAGRVL